MASEKVGSSNPEFGVWKLVFTGWEKLYWRAADSRLPEVSWPEVSFVPWHQSLSPFPCWRRGWWDPASPAGGWLLCTATGTAAAPLWSSLASVLWSWTNSSAIQACNQLGTRWKEQGREPKSDSWVWNITRPSLRDIWFTATQHLHVCVQGGQGFHYKCCKG